MAAKIGSLVVDVEGYVLTPEETEMLNHPLIGGVILFVRNYESKQQLKKLCADIRAARTEPILIMVDQEGGRVQRFTHEFTIIPSMSTFGKLYDSDPELALTRVQDCGWLLASELLEVGVDISLAPVLDLNNPKSNVIGERAFHADPNVVTALAKGLIAGMREAGMAAVGKHFPGHGSISADSHHTHPIDHRSYTEIYDNDMVPFSHLISQGIPGIMAAHIVFPQIDDKTVGYSSVWLRDILRSQLKFRGLILTDCLSMEGANISSSYAERFVLAREAGCDLALLCNNRRGVIEVLDAIAIKDHQIPKEQWALLQSVPLPSRDNQPKWQKTQEFLARIRQ